jgi:hypothetical protein
MVNPGLRPPAKRYRIVAADAHSWSSLLVEDEDGARFLYVVATATLAALEPSAVDHMLATRAYRPWLGDRAWAPLDRLPIYTGGPVPGSSADSLAPLS